MADPSPQETLKEVKQWLIRQRFTMGMAYTVALLMLLCATSNAAAHDMLNALIQGGLGTFNCYLGDITRHRYTLINKSYKELKKEMDKFNNLKNFHEQLIKILEKLKQNQK